MFKTYTNIPFITVVLLLLVMVLPPKYMQAQTKIIGDEANLQYYFKHASYHKKDSSGITFYFINKIQCKGKLVNVVKYIFGKNGDPLLNAKTGTPAEIRPAFLQLHGNISYTFDYRSRLDTPFAATNLQQHNEQVYADAVFKGRYPFRIILNSRQSNSPFFKNYTDVNVQFNHQAYQQIIKNEMIAALTRRLGLLDSIGKYDGQLKEKKQEYFTQKNWIDDPARMQEIVQEKEQVYGSYAQMLAAKKNDSLGGEKNLPVGSIVSDKWTQDSLSYCPSTGSCSC